MKLRRFAVVASCVLALCSAGYAFQRVADWGTPSQGNEKAEFSWSRLAYNTNFGGGGGGYGGYGGYGRGRFASR